MKRFIYLVVVVLLSGCNSLIKVSVPLHRGERPETRGQPWKMYGSAGVGRAHEVVILNDASSRPPNFGQVDNHTKGYHELWGRASMTPLAWLDVGVKYNASTVPMVFLKTQIIGDHENTATKGNFALSATLGLAGKTFTDRGETYIYPEGYNGWSSDLYMRGTDAALILGYRLSDEIQIFGGPYYTHYMYTGNLRQDAHSSGLPQVDYPLTGSGKVQGANLAFEWSQYREDRRTFAIGAEVIVAGVEFDRARSSVETAGNFWITIY